jgi:hypothetical protein
MNGYSEPAKVRAAWPGLAAGIALLARDLDCPDVSREDIIGDLPAAEVIQGLEIVARAVLEALAPDGCTGRVLQKISLAMTLETQQGGGP